MLFKLLFLCCLLFVVVVANGMHEGYVERVRMGKIPGMENLETTGRGEICFIIDKKTLKADMKYYDVAPDNCDLVDEVFIKERTPHGNVYSSEAIEFGMETFFKNNMRKR